MKLSLATVVLLGAIALSYGLTPEEFDASFIEFKQQFNRNYESPEWELMRREIFAQNLALIEKHNSEADQGLHSFRLGVNNFTDLTNEEFRRYFLRPARETSAQRGRKMKDIATDLPASVDWTLKGMVTPVPNMGPNGASWAYSASGAIESAWAIAGNQLVALSEQQLVDCCVPAVPGGQCSTDDAFNYVMMGQGLDTQAGYPTTGTGCRFNAKSVGATIQAYAEIYAGYETVLQSAVATNGPNAVLIDASQPSFQLYQSGVYSDSKCSQVINGGDHELLVVGYGHDDTSNTDFWKAKNWWGVNWGESGYIRMARGVNLCGIANNATYPMITY